VQASTGDLAKLALDAKLVDGLKTPHEMESCWRSAARRTRQGRRSFRQVDMYDYLARNARPALLDQQAKVAVVVAQGEIVDGKQPQGTSAAIPPPS
jgi:protease-4